MPQDRPSPSLIINPRPANEAHVAEGDPKTHADGRLGHTGSKLNAPAGEPMPDASVRRFTPGMSVDRAQAREAGLEYRGGPRTGAATAGDGRQPRGRRAATLTLMSALLATTVLAAMSSATASDRGSQLPPHVQQGAMVIGRTMAANRVEVGGKSVRVADDGTFVFGVGRDQSEPVRVEIAWFDGVRESVRVNVRPRDWPIQRIDGVPPNTVNPPPDIAARIAREQARVAESRKRDDARTDFAQPFLWPVRGRISGRFGNQRIYNGTPKSPHSGMDIAAADGTPVKAPAGGIVTFADAGLYLTGGTVVIDHGAGISSNFLHLSRIDVKVGDRVEQGQVFAAVGSTGRSTGPHLHWGMNWFDVRIDPLLVLELAQPPRTP